MRKLNTAILLAIFVFVAVTASTGHAAPPSENVFVVPVRGVIDSGLARFVERGIKLAQSGNAKAIIIEIDTPGGEINAAQNISDAILNASVPTISYVNDEAASAGVLVAISSKTLVVAPGATIGAAETRPNEEKYISWWASRLRNTAERTGRDPELVAAMADADVTIEGLKEKGKILSLTARQALDLHFADSMASSRADLLKSQNLTGAKVTEVKPNMAERIAQMATNPYISPILLTIGIVGVITEILTPGFGIPGLLGLFSFSLFFGGNLLAGATSYWVIGLFILGLLLLTIEIFIPGFGVFGIAGIISVIGSIIMAYPTPEQALLSIVIALLASGAIMYVLLKYLIKTPVFDRIILSTKQDKSKGYVASTGDTASYFGKEGTAITPLRPAGAGEIDGKRLDMVTEGEFVPAGSRIKVIKVEGGKIVVKKIGKENK